MKIKTTTPKQTHADRVTQGKAGDFVTQVEHASARAL
jgi:hypothetical protein